MDEAERRARLEALFAAHARTVLVFARRRTDAANAADVLSEVFIVAWRRLDDVPADAVPWLLACARRTLLHQQRAETRRSKLVEHLRANTLHTEFSPDLPDDALAQAFAALGERDREVLLLTAWEGLSAKQAARVLGCSPQAFWVRTHRARKRLGAALLAVDAPTTPLTMEACND
jgi:RNA polymerase sigma-70 factor (ECF subfamily)